jgi:hypothetical protein
MADDRKHDFSGYATKAGLRCSDGRTITPDAFKHMDGKRIPLVWMHGHHDPENVLGHAVLEARDDGMYTYAFFNKTKKAVAAKESVEHGDYDSLSIFANQLVEHAKQVTHGVIREVSLVLAGANPGAKIDFINLQHGDGTLVESDEDAIIHTGLKLEHATSEEEPDESDEDNNDDSDEDEDEDLAHAAKGVTAKDATIKDVYDAMDEDEKNVLHYMIAAAVEEAVAEEAASHSDNKPGEGDLIHKEGADEMSRNVFDQTDAKDGVTKKHELSHDALKGIFEDAKKNGSLKTAVENYAANNLEHGITDIDTLFPDAKMATGTIELEKRRTEWVSAVINGTRHTPFSRIKTFVADLTQDEARAKGYIKGNYKLEEWFGVTKRTTGPTTIYKKQKLDRDDMLDITDFDIVTFLKAEMRLMTEEEFARAVLIGDGRDVSDEDKVKDPMGVADGNGLRSILNDHELFVTTLNVNVADADSSYEEVVDAVMDGFEYYKGTGTPTFFTTIPHLNKFLKARDLNGRRYYETKQQVADALGVDRIVTVEPMKEVPGLIGIIVNLDDYNVGTDKGGELTMFEDFDIDYNQQKYLLETRASGALVRPKSAIVIRETEADDVLATPQKPAFNADTGVVTIPTVTGVVYKNGSGTTLTAGDQAPLAAGASTTIYSVPATGYYFADNQSDSWPFKRKAA